MDNTTFANEKERRKFIMSELVKNGWTEVDEEIFCDEKINGKRPFRLDIMGRPPNCLHFVGIELKIYEGVRRGGKFFEALKQTLDYKGKHFKGKKIDIWVIDLYKENFSEWHDDTFRSSWIFMQSFLQKLGIGMLRGEDIVFMINDSKHIYHLNLIYSTNETDWNAIYRRTLKTEMKIVELEEE